MQLCMHRIMYSVGAVTLYVLYAKDIARVMGSVHGTLENVVLGC